MGQSDSNWIHVYSDTVFFDFGKYNIREGDSLKLQKTVRAGTKLKKALIKIEAHTDNVGTNNANITLSENRAKAVSSLLSRAGVPDDFMELGFEGEERPIATNNNEEGRQLNRRVIVSVYRPGKPKKITTTVPNVEPPPPPPPSEYKIIVIDEETTKPLAAELTIIINNDRNEFQLDSSGLHLFKLNSSIPANLLAYHEGYVYSSLNVEMTPGGTQIIKLKKFEKGANIVLENLFFFGNQAVLRPTSEPALQLALRMLQNNEMVHVEIGGHINKPGVHPDNLDPFDRELAVRRAKFVYEFLVENGIDKKRLTYKGYGNKHMLFPNARTREEMHKNMRVEFKVVDP